MSPRCPYDRLPLCDPDAVSCVVDERARPEAAQHVFSRSDMFLFVHRKFTTRHSEGPRVHCTLVKSDDVVHGASEPERTTASESVKPTNDKRVEGLRMY